MSVYSMTGYASGQQTAHGSTEDAPAWKNAQARLGLELRSVNSRFLDLGFRLSDELRQHEPALRELLGKRLKRGKVELRAYLQGRDAGTLADPPPRVLQRLASVQDQVRVWLPDAAPLSVADALRAASSAEPADDEGTAKALMELAQTVLDDFEYRHLRLKGIKVRPNTDVGKALKIEDLFRDGYKAIFIGTGVWRPNTLHIKGESLGNVHYAINYLQNPDVYHLGNRVIVIGAGNAAMDVARTAIRHGTRHLECFSLSSHITASEYEASYAKLEGVNFIFNKKPLEITDKGVVFIDLNEAEDGTLTEIPGTEKLYPADSVIVSISQGPCTTITDSTKNLKTTPRGLFETDEVGRTSIPGIFASGDAVKGARTVVEAVAYSKNVAEAMHEYMQTLPPDLPDEYANVPVAEYDEGN